MQMIDDFADQRVQSPQTVSYLGYTTLAKLAPSSFNMQNYRFVVVKDKEVRKQNRAAAWDQAQVTDASVLLAVCADLNAHKENPARYCQHVPAEVRDFMVSHVTPFYEGKTQLTRGERLPDGDVVFTDRFSAAHSA